MFLLSIVFIRFMKSALLLRLFVYQVAYASILNRFFCLITWFHCITLVMICAHPYAHRAYIIVLDSQSV